MDFTWKWIDSEEIVNQYLNVSSSLPLSGSTYVKLPKELNHPMKGLINIQNNDKNCFLWCHVRHLNLDGKNLWRINDSGVDFPVSKKDYNKISVSNETNINVLFMKIKQFTLFICLISVLMMF